MIDYLPPPYLVGVIVAFDIQILIATTKSGAVTEQKISNLIRFLASNFEILVGKNLSFLVTVFLMLFAMLAFLLVHVLVLIKIITLIIP